MKKIAKTLDSMWMFAAMAIWLVVLLIIHSWPASWWLEVRDVRVSDAGVNEPVVMAVDRSVNRSFTATWTVVVRRWEFEGWSVACQTTSQSNYEPGAVLPERLTLSWWTSGACADLKPGRYSMTTIWRIDPPPFLPTKMITVKSNIFEIKGTP